MVEKNEEHENLDLGNYKIEVETLYSWEARCATCGFVTKGNRMTEVEYNAFMSAWHVLEESQFNGLPAALCPSCNTEFNRNWLSDGLFMLARRQHLVRHADSLTKELIRRGVIGKRLRRA